MQLPHDLKLIHVTNEFDVSEFVRPIPLYTGQSSTTRLDQAGLDTLKSLLSRILSVYGFKITLTSNYSNRYERILNKVAPKLDFEEQNRLNHL